MNVVANMPTAANAKPMNDAAGSASSAHQDCTAPASQRDHEERGGVERARASATS